MFEYLVEHAFAGVWSMIWHFGIGVGLIVLFLAVAYFSPLGKKWFIAAAIGVALFMGGEVVGVKMGTARCTAQAQAVSKFVHRTVQSTTTKRSRAASDPWDNKVY